MKEKIFSVLAILAAIIVEYANICLTDFALSWLTVGQPVRIAVDGFLAVTCVVTILIFVYGRLSKGMLLLLLFFQIVNLLLNTWGLGVSVDNYVAGFSLAWVVAGPRILVYAIVFIWFNWRGKAKV